MMELRPIFHSFLISITLYLCVSFMMFLLCKHVHLTCVFNKLMMMMMVILFAHPISLPVYAPPLYGDLKR